MSVNGISLLSAAPSTPGTDKSGALGGKFDSERGFSDILRDALSIAKSTDSQDKSNTLALLTGEADDVASLLIDAQKAEIALSLTIELRNNLMNAYNEIMNMQV